MIEVHVVESPNTILLQTEINKFLEDLDRANLIDIKFTSPQIDLAPPAKYAAMIIYEHKSNMDQPVGIE